MKRKTSQAAKVREYIKAHPEATSKQVAEALKVSVNRVHTLRWHMKKAAEKSLPITMMEEEPIKPIATDTDMVNHPPHYTDGGIDTIDFIESKGLGYHLGNVVKYISRAGKKGTNAGLEDLRKAQWYLTRAIEKNEVGPTTR